MALVPDFRDLISRLPRAWEAVTDVFGDDNRVSSTDVVAPPFQDTEKSRQDSATVKRQDGCISPGSSAQIGNCAGYDGWIDYVPRPVLNQQVIDLLYLQNRLVQRIVDRLPSDMMAEAPDLTSKIIDPTRLWDYGSMLGFPGELTRGMSYARKHGGGGILVMLEDGMDPREEVDLRRVTGIRGFFALRS